VHGLTHDESLAAAGEAAEVEFAACFQGLSFYAEVAVEAAFVLREEWKRSEKK
jgi:hypothetical protein